MLKNLDNYAQSDPIGNGGYGKVYLAEENQTGNRFAVKFLHLLQQYHSDEAFQEEVDRLSSVHHLCLKKIIGCVTENQSETQPEQLPGIITTYESTGSIDKEIKDNPSPPWINIANQTVFLFAIASALNKLHENKIYHGDLKPSNIFLSKNPDSHGFYIPLISDYGLASISEPEESVTQSAFRAPELINRFVSPSESKPDNETNSTEVFEPNEKTDAFSFGMLTFYIFVNKFPRGKNAKPLLQAFRPDIPKNIPHGIRKVIAQCWDHDPSQRPSMKTVMKMIIESKIDLEYPNVGEFMYELEPQLYSLTQINLLHHDNIKSRTLMDKKEQALNDQIAELKNENQELKNENKELKTQIKKLKDFEELSKSQIDEVKNQVENNIDLDQKIESAKTEAVTEAVNQSFEKLTEQLKDKKLRNSLLNSRSIPKRIKKKVLKKVAKNSEESSEEFAELTGENEEDKFEYAYEYEYEEEDDFDEADISSVNKRLLNQMSQDLELLRKKQDESEKAVQEIGEGKFSDINKTVDDLSQKVDAANGIVMEFKSTFVPSISNLQTDYGNIKAELENKFSQLEQSLKEISDSYQKVNDHVNQLNSNVETISSQNSKITSRGVATPYLGDLPNYDFLSDMDQNVVKIIEDFNQRLNKIEMMMNLQNEEVSSCLERLNLLSGANLSNIQKKLSEIESLVGKVTIHKDELEANLIRYAIPVNVSKEPLPPKRFSPNSSTRFSPSSSNRFSPNSSQKSFGSVNLQNFADEEEEEFIAPSDENDNAHSNPDEQPNNEEYNGEQVQHEEDNHEQIQHEEDNGKQNGNEEEEKGSKPHGQVFRLTPFDDF